MYQLLSHFSDFIGIVGVVFVLVAYYLLSTNKTSANSVAYQVANLVGSALVLYSLYFNWNTASVLVEAMWIAISCVGLYRIFRERRQN